MGFCNTAIIVIPHQSRLKFFHSIGGRKTIHRDGYRGELYLGKAIMKGGSAWRSRSSVADLERSPRLLSILPPESVISRIPKSSLEF